MPQVSGTLGSANGARKAKVFSGVTPTVAAVSLCAQ
jgi:hypothetical protein